MSALDDWLAEVGTELGIDDEVQVRLLLDVARDVAHGVLRPAAPLTTYLVGVAVGRGLDPGEAAGRVSALVAARAVTQDVPAGPAGPAATPPPAG